MRMRTSAGLVGTISVGATAYAIFVTARPACIGCCANTGANTFFRMRGPPGRRECPGGEEPMGVYADGRGISRMSSSSSDSFSVAISG